MKRTLAACFLAGGVTLLAQSQPPAPSSGNTDRQTQNTSASQQKVAAPVPPQPVDVRLIQPVSIAPSPTESQGPDYYGTVADWWMVGLTALTLLATVVLLWVAWTQFGVQKKQTEDALAVARDANLQTSEAARIGRIMEHPPKIVVRNVSIPENSFLFRGEIPADDQMTAAFTDLQAGFTMTNIGQSQATVTKVRTTWVVGRFPMLNPSENYLGMVVDWRIPPGFTMHGRSQKNVGTPNDPSVIVHIDESRKTQNTYLVGCLWYRDDLTDPNKGEWDCRRAAFCRRWDRKRKRFVTVIATDYSYTE